MLNNRAEWCRADCAHMQTEADTRHPLQRDGSAEVLHAQKTRRSNLTEWPRPRPEQRAARPKAQTNNSTTDFIIKTKHTANKPINAKTRGKSESPVIAK